MQRLVGDIERRVDAELRAEWDIGLGWFDVLAALRATGTVRPSVLADELQMVPSSLSRRLDHLEAEGWVERRPAVGDDKRAVVVELTTRGRQLWREMLVTYRRSVQAQFAGVLDDGDIAALHSAFDRLDEVITDELDESPDGF